MIKPLTTLQREFLFEMYTLRTKGVGFLIPSVLFKIRTGERLVQLGLAKRVDRYFQLYDGKLANNGKPRSTYEITARGWAKIHDISCPRCGSIYSLYMKECDMHSCSQCVHIWPAEIADEMQSHVA
jgi:hypothetical protein